jgi:hypothetical protein
MTLYLMEVSESNPLLVIVLLLCLPTTNADVPHVARMRGAKSRLDIVWLGSTPVINTVSIGFIFPPVINVPEQKAGPSQSQAVIHG